MAKLSGYDVEIKDGRINKLGGRGMNNDISTMYTKDKNQKTGRKGYFRWQDEKEKAIRPSDYGDYILQRRKRGKRK